MHFLVLMGAILAGIVLLMLGLLSVWKDLSIRGPWDAPLVKEDESWKWPKRSGGSSTIESDLGS